MDMPGLLAIKQGITQIFVDGKLVPVTVLKAGPCYVVTKKTRERDGYDAVQIGYGELDPSRRPKAYSGHFLKKGSQVFRYLKEFKTAELNAYEMGDQIGVQYFSSGDRVDVCGTSKGKGFQGVMKRHHFAGGNDSHGCSVSHRVPGSIGQNTWPGRVYKGKRMAGRMGGERVTLKNLTVVDIDLEHQLILVKGGIPGANRGLVTLLPKDGAFEKRFVEGKKK